MSPDSQLGRLLAQSGRERLKALVGASASVAAAGCMLLLVIVVALDAAVGFERAGLWLLDLLLLAAALATCIGCWLQLRRERLDPLSTAAYVERRAKVPNNRLLNAVALSVQAPAHASAQLIAHAQGLAEACASGIAPRALVDFKPLKRGLFAAGAVLALAFGLALVFPRVVAAVVPRLLAPGAGKPAYCPIDFDLTVEPQFVRVGASATFKATLWGEELSESVDVLIRDASGHTERLPMLLAGVQPQRRSYTYALTNLTAPLWLAVATPVGTSTFTPLRLSQLQGLDVEYDYPAYSKLPRTVKPLENPELRALVGTHVKLIARTLDERANVRMTVQGAGANGKLRELAMQALGKSRVAASFDIETDGSYSLQPAAANAKELMEPALRGQIKALPDLVPTIEVVEPARHLVVAEGQRVQIELRARDDFGIGKLLIRRAVNGWTASSLELPLPAERRDVSARYELDLNSLGARAGDVITYSATAIDAHPSGTQYADTPPHIIEVIGLADYESFARSRFRMDDMIDELEKYHAAVANLRERKQELADQLSSRKNGQPLTPEQRRAQAELETELAAQAAQAEKLAEAMRARSETHPLFEFEPGYQAHLRELAKQVEEHAARADKLKKALARERASGEGGDVPSALERFRTSLSSENEDKGKRTADDAQKLRAADALQRQLERIRYVVGMQRALADQLRDMGADRSAAALVKHRLQRSAEDERELVAELRDASARLAQLGAAAAKLLPKMSKSALALSEAITELKITQDQAQAITHALASELTPAHASAESAARKLESLQSQATPSAGDVSQDLDGCLSLTKPTAAKALQQLAEGGRLPGSSAGSGAASPVGSVARTQVMGPGADQGGSGENRRALFKNAAQAAAEPAQAVTVTPDALSPYSGEPTERRGVPARYQPSVNAYFKRLAEDQRTERP